ncbi:beta-lactamase class A [Edaphobacter aggregans]|uniref:Beta-lactamase class A n=2 Tax=Edaphobacter aggregans TaxID=570835 RepID=A0A3R9R114_9BACT|nr:beta-lactamase class A [Edaphobacter aggregans]
MHDMRFRFVGWAMTAGVVLFGLIVGGAWAQQTGVADAGLQQELAALVEKHHGKVALYATQLNTGKSVAIDADRPVQTASVIKLTILFEAMEQVRAGKARWDEKLTLVKGDGVSGSGVLTFFDTPLMLTLKDVLTMMVIVSDNTATNLAIDRFGVDAVNARIAWMGLKDTHLYKKIGKPATGPMPADQPKFGLGKTTAREMAMVMERIGRCQLAERGEPMLAGDAAICEVALKMLRNQFYRETIPRYLEKLDSSETGSGIASKTGSLNAVRADVAIVAGKTGPMVLSIFTFDNEDKSWTVDNEGEVLIGRLAKTIVEAWSPAGLDGKTLIPGLGLAGPVASEAAGASK